MLLENSPATLLEISSLTTGISFSFFHFKTTPSSDKHHPLPVRMSLLEDDPSLVVAGVTGDVGQDCISMQIADSFKVRYRREMMKADGLWYGGELTKAGWSENGGEIRTAM
ncbi:hypothetical protein L2E82_51425 [Cichorium intybus]|nr:hypothetical protein L2E82_51425 [Cichorium intybus]